MTERASDCSFKPLPFELIEEIGQKGDRTLLLSFSLLSHSFVRSSRALLFETVEFKNRYRNATDFDKFLDLLDGPYTTIPPSVRTLRVYDRITRKGRNGECRDRATTEVATLASKLVNLSCIQLTKLPGWLPEVMFQLFRHLPAPYIKVQLDGVDFREHGGVVRFWARLPPSAQVSQLLEVFCHSTDAESQFLLYKYSDLFRRALHFDALDTSSILLFHEMWDPVLFPSLDITVDSFRLYLLSRYNYIAPHLAFIIRFIRHVGPTFNQLGINLSDPWGQGGKDVVLNMLDTAESFIESLDRYATIDLSTCTNLRSLAFAILQHNRSTSKVDETMWFLIDSLPRSSLQIITLAFNFGYFCEERMVDVGWNTIAVRLKARFPALRRLRFKIAKGTSRRGSPDLSTVEGQVKVDGLDVGFEAFEWSNGPDPPVGYLS